VGLFGAEHSPTPSRGKLSKLGYVV
jgi:hypothetical protein